MVRYVLVKERTSIYININALNYKLDKEHEGISEPTYRFSNSPIHAYGCCLRPSLTIDTYIGQSVLPLDKPSRANLHRQAAPDQGIPPLQ